MFYYSHSELMAHVPIKKTTSYPWGRKKGSIRNTILFHEKGLFWLSEFRGISCDVVFSRLFMSMYYVSQIRVASKVMNILSKEDCVPLRLLHSECLILSLSSTE